MAAAALLLAAADSAGQNPQAGKTAWPDALVEHDGKHVDSAAEFLARRRPELLHDFEENVYGRTPSRTIPLRFRVTSADTHALNGMAVRKQVTLTVGPADSPRELHLLLYLPANSGKRVPVFVGLNFNGNQTVSADPGIDLHDVWVLDPELAASPVAKEQKGHIRVRATDGSRGASAAQWPVEEIVRAGYGLATMYAGDIEPDFAAGIGYGVRPLFFAPGQALPAPDEWGAIGAWAWGMSRIADYLETDESVDPGALIALGHSRFGKTALWAAAQDSRFAMVIANESGQGGASLSHREAGESIAHLNMAFPYWFCANYHQFTGRTDQLPVDGHLLLALIAPRPLFVASAAADPYSDPEGEFLSSVAAGSVYRLFGKQGLPADARFEVSRLQGKTLRYDVRPGGHDILLEDWKRYIEFANEYFQTGQH